MDIGVPTTLDGVLTVHWTVAGVSGPGTSITANSPENNGTIDWTGKGHFSDSTTFTNRGTVAVSDDAGMDLSAPQLVNAQTGKVLLSDGGSISVTGDLSNAGSRGLSDDRATVSGNYTQAASGTLSVEVAGDDNSGELEAGGTASLAGTLALSKEASYRFTLAVRSRCSPLA